MAGEGARRGRPGYDQETVLRLAVELFNRQGYDATSMGDLARHLGLSKSAIYHHVPSKEHLLSTALDEALVALGRAVDRAVDPAAEDRAVVRLRTLVLASVRILVDHLPAVTLLLRVRGNSEVELDAVRRRRELDDRVAGLVRRSVAEGDVRDDLDPVVISRLLFGMVNSLVEWVDPHGSLDADDLATTVADLAFAGLLRR
ncbi:TetR/AcrR family transcriptional regulator [Nocardioides korecus]